MGNFITLGKGDDEYQPLLDLEVFYEQRIDAALLAQADYIFSSSEYLANFDKSGDMLKEVLASAILAYSMLGADYADSLIGSIIPGYSSESGRAALQQWAMQRVDESFELIQRTSRRRLAALLTTFAAGTYSVKWLIEQYTTLATGIARANLINEYESIKAFNQGIVITLRHAGFAEQVIWQAINDERTCLICGSRHNVSYPLNVAPELPAHAHCRCRWAFVLDKRRIVSVYLGF